MAMLETPSRIWRRIEATEGHDMPSLPSPPAFEDSDAEPTTSPASDHESESDPDISSPFQSTPTTSSHSATVRAPSSVSSTARFARSLTSRGSRSPSFIGPTSAASSFKRSLGSQEPQKSFDISTIPSLPQVEPELDTDLDDSDVELSHRSMLHEQVSKLDLNGQEDGELSLADALQSVSRTSSPLPPEEVEAGHTQKRYDFSVSLKSEPKASPFDKMRNVSFRKPLPRMRTPSLSRTTPSPSSSSSNSTPHSYHSIGPFRSRTVSPSAAATVPLPPSNNGSPAGAASSSQGNIFEHTEDNDPGPDDDNAATRDDDDLDVRQPEISRTDLQAGRNSEGSDEREPTFSSEELATLRTYASSSALSLEPSNISGRSPPAFLTAPSSPAPSTIFTPTPAFQPRPRARFLAASPSPNPNLGAPFTPAAFQTHLAHDIDPTTPFARRRSFLLDIINSTVRPRLGHPTPHPYLVMDTPIPAQLETPGPENGSHEVDESTIAGPARTGRLHAAFAGVTPLPRPRVRAGRLSHPLTQAWTMSSESEDVARSEAGSQSPYDIAGNVHHSSQLRHRMI